MTTGTILRETMRARLIGALGGWGPFAAVGAVSALVGALDGDAAWATLAFFAVLAVVDGAIVGPLVIRPRRRALRGASFYAVVAVLLWIGVGLIGVFVELLTGPGSATNPLVLLVGRLAYAAIYGLILLAPLWFLGAIWVVVTWLVDGVMGGT
jgi:hypothetical protein